MIDDIQIDQIVKIVKSRILDTESNYYILSELIENAHLENKLLNISTFEKISFHLNPDKIITNITPSVERFSLVFPPSYECTFPIRLEGHYLVKYPSSNVALPMQIPAFTIEYIVILVKDQDSFQLKHEHIRLSEND